MSAGFTRPPVRALTLSLPAAAGHREVTSAAARAVAIGAHLQRAGFPVQTVRVTGPAITTIRSTLQLQDAAELLVDGCAQAGVDSVSLGALRPHTLPGLTPAAVAALLVDRPALFLSVVVADGDEVHGPTVDFAAEVTVALARTEPTAAFRFSAIANVAPHSAFFPGSYSHGGECGVSVGLESAGCLLDALTHGPLRRDAITELTRTRLDRALADVDTALRAAAAAHGVSVHGYDPSPACSPQSSLAEFVERAGGVPFGLPGTLSTIAAVTAGVRAVSVPTVGYRGLMLPVLEDRVLAHAWQHSRVTANALLAYSAVCGAGLDTIPLPGRTSTSTVAGLISDLAALSARWHKPLSARIMPAHPNADPHRTHYDSPHLVNITYPPVPEAVAND